VLYYVSTVYCTVCTILLVLYCVLACGVSRRATCSRTTACGCTACCASRGTRRGGHSGVADPAVRLMRRYPYKYMFSWERDWYDIDPPSRSLAGVAHLVDIGPMSTLRCLWNQNRGVRRRLGPAGAGWDNLGESTVLYTHFQQCSVPYFTVLYGTLLYGTVGAVCVLPRTPCMFFTSALFLPPSLPLTPISAPPSLSLSLTPSLLRNLKLGCAGLALLRSRRGWGIPSETRVPSRLMKKRHRGWGPYTRLGVSVRSLPISQPRPE